MRKPLYAHILPHVTILQEREQIEDGWQIKITIDTIELWEIPLYGGDENLIGEYPSVQEAYKQALTLT